MVNKMTQNYAGFKDKIAEAGGNSVYRHFTDSLQQQAAGKEAPACLKVMSAYLSFFKDQHVSVFIDEDSANYPAIRRLFARTAQVHMTAAQLEQYLRQTPGRDSLEGIWEDESRQYRIGIIRDKHKPNEFTGFVLRADSLYWMPGQVKLKARKTGSTYDLYAYASRDHSISRQAFTVTQQQLEIGPYGSWYKVFPGRHERPAPTAPRDRKPSFRMLDAQTGLLTIPSAGMPYRPMVDSIMREQDATLKKLPHLVIDVRNNTGGTVLCFEKLYPLLYTQPYITEGASVMATDDNITNYYDKWDFPGVQDSMKAVFKKEAATLRAHQGGMYSLWPADTLTFKSVLPYPQRVSIIINEYCASSTELFLLKAMQSKKVKLYGAHTMGAVDYSDAVTMKMPCALFSIRYSTSKTDRLPEHPLDNIGIQPDVHIPGNVKDWVQFVRDSQE